MKSKFSSRIVGSILMSTLALLGIGVFLFVVVMLPQVPIVVKAGAVMVVVWILIACHPRCET